MQSVTRYGSNVDGLSKTLNRPELANFHDPELWDKTLVVIDNAAGPMKSLEKALEVLKVSHRKGWKVTDIIRVIERDSGTSSIQELRWQLQSHATAIQGIQQQIQLLVISRSHHELSRTQYEVRTVLSQLRFDVQNRQIRPIVPVPRERPEQAAQRAQVWPPDLFYDAGEVPINTHLPDLPPTNPWAAVVNPGRHNSAVPTDLLSTPNPMGTRPSNVHTSSESRIHTDNYLRERPQTLHSSLTAPGPPTQPLASSTFLKRPKQQYQCTINRQTQDEASPKLPEFETNQETF